MSSLLKLPESCLTSFLQVSELFRSIDSSFFAEIASIASVSHYKAGECVWQAGEKATDFVIIKRGMVRLTKRMGSNENCTLALYGAKETIGLPALMGPGVYPTTAVALTQSVEVCRLNAAMVRKILGDNLEFSTRLNEILLRLYFTLQNKIEVVSSGSVSERIQVLFRYLADRFGDEDEDGNVYIPVHLSRAQIAEMVGVRIETVIRTMSGWQKRGAIFSMRDGFLWNQSISLKEDALSCLESEYRRAVAL